MPPSDWLSAFTCESVFHEEAGGLVTPARKDRLHLFPITFPHAPQAQPTLLLYPLTHKYPSHPPLLWGPELRLVFVTSALDCPANTLSLLQISASQGLGLLCIKESLVSQLEEEDDAYRQRKLLSNPFHTEVCYSRIPEPLGRNNFFFFFKRKEFFELPSKRGGRMGVTPWVTLGPQRKVWLHLLMLSPPWSVSSMDEG